MLAPLIEELEWADPWNHPHLWRDPEERFNIEAYQGFVGDDPEWNVSGTLAGYEAGLAQVAARTLVTTGRWDRITPPAIAYEIHARLPNSKLAVFERSAHRPWAEEPDAWFAVVDDFLRGG